MTAPTPPENWQEDSTSFLRFMSRTGSPQYCVLAAEEMLQNVGYEKLHEENKWRLLPGKKYYAVRGGTTIAAFDIPLDVDNMKCVISTAHTDSPSLKIRPNGTVRKDGFLSLGVDIYGGGLWHTWFDRELGICGSVIVKNSNGGSEERFVRINDPICIIPNLPIHLQTPDERKAFVINAENHLRPLLCGPGEDDALLSQDPATKKMQKRLPPPLLELISAKLGIEAKDIVDVDLTLFDANPARQCGVSNQWIASQRLDNHASVYAVFSAIVKAQRTEANKDVMFVSIGWDHEEIGSKTAYGADSSLLEIWLNRVFTAFKTIGYDEFIQKSFMLSVDGAHAFHPSYSEKFQTEHRCIINQGPVMKWNSNMKYTTHHKTACILRMIAEEAGVPIQDFVVRNDSPCGSTIGPLASSRLGIRSVDLGCPMWAMHSIRESMGTYDLTWMKVLVVMFFENFSKY